MMNRIRILSIAALLGGVAFGTIGCSEETQDKWEKAGKAVGEAAKDTAKEAKEGAKEVIENAKATDPDTGMTK